MNDELLSLGLGFGFIAFVFAIMILFYVINAFALHKIANNRGSDKGWFAWVPILNSFLVPLLVEDDVVESLRGRFTIAYLIALVLSIIPFLGIVFSIIAFIMAFYAFYVLINQYTNNAVIYIIVTVITFGVAMPFLLLRIRNREVIA